MQEYQMSLGVLAEALQKHGLLLKAPEEILSKTVKHLVYNSKEVTADTLFICKGLSFKEAYLLGAIEQGAVCYLSEQSYDVSIPGILVKDIRKAMSLAAVVFYGNPQQHLKLVGITGTKGKTTTSYFIKNVLDSAVKKRTAVLSTVEVYTGGYDEQAHLTTPESVDLQKYLADAAAHEKEFLTMEVSSQAYKMDRVYGMEFDYGFFLNIGVDHIGPLEHENFEDYFGCKLEFIRHCKTVFINKNTDNLERVLEAAKHAQKVVLFGTDESCDYWVDSIEKQKQGFSFDVVTQKERHHFSTDMDGRFNVENALCAIALAKELGIGDEEIQEGINHITVQGRMNVYHKDGYTVIVDYAHNYLSFEKLYSSVKLDYPGQEIITVFGCPGGKNFLRRRDIGTLSGEYAQRVYLTAEDPQFEDVTEICEDIAQYLKPYGTPYEIIPDRTEAIETALSRAKPNQVLLITGKGEELYQKVRGEYVDYESDTLIVKRCLGIKD
jgi:UDP-N-acetylmuramyl-tripeptide synthetase